MLACHSTRRRQGFLQFHARKIKPKADKGLEKHANPADFLHIMRKK
jgi:hypothetical protein